MSRISKKIRQGFTVIEVSLFLAITALIFVGMIVGINSSLTQNHYEDDVRSIVEFIQDAYSKVTSVENDQRGNSEMAIYGKLITFGEENSFVGANTNQSVHIYDVVGDIAETDTGSTLSSLKTLEARVTKLNDAGNGRDYIGVADVFTTRWGSTIERQDNNDKKQAALLIVRSPATGSIFTYATNDGVTIEVNKMRNQSMGDQLTEYLTSNRFSSQDLDLCINMEGKVYGGKRKDIRIKKGARSSSDVQVIPLDDADNRCVAH
ncbi:hypothetical protein J6T21_02250 [Candidatus Saccharibacteria bacterium]|nr:hypothetical protein [Candidatus Saccharibacteria bacterium]